MRTRIALDARGRGDHRLHGIGLPEHRCRKDVETRTAFQEQFRDIPPAGVGGGPKRRLPVAEAPIPGGVYQSRMLVKQCTGPVNVTMTHTHHLTYLFGPLTGKFPPNSV